MLFRSYTNKKFTPEEKKVWTRFVDGHDRQIIELLSDYGQIDLLWFDFMHPNGGDFVWGEKELKQKILQQNPSLIVNNRIGNEGDYHTAGSEDFFRMPENGCLFQFTMNSFYLYIFFGIIKKIEE